MNCKRVWVGIPLMRLALRCMRLYLRTYVFVTVSYALFAMTEVQCLAGVQRNDFGFQCKEVPNCQLTA